MRIVFFGTPQFAVATLEKLLSSPDFTVVAIVTQPDKRRGRGNETIPSAVKKIALEHQLPVWQPERIKKNRETLEQLNTANADAFVVVAYGQILSREILKMPRLGCINVHGSILPEYRGAAPIQWSICDGKTETGITTMLMDKGMDTGAMLLKAYTPIGLFDNAQEIATVLAQQGADLLIETLIKLEKQTLQPIAQDNNKATYAPLIDKPDFSIYWHNSALALHNRIRGFYPNCVATFRGKTLKITATIPLSEEVFPQFPPHLQTLIDVWHSNLSGTPGEVVSTIKNWGAAIQTGSGLLLLKEVQLAGKRPQSGWDFVNGMRLTVGEILGNGEAEKV